jgi:hypothetical protein
VLIIPCYLLFLQGVVNYFLNSLNTAG